MIDLMLNTTLILLVVSSLGLVGYVVVSFFHEPHSKKGDKRLNQMVNTFLSAGVKDNGGRHFIGLINVGVLLTLLIGNGSSGFSSLRHLDDFRKQNNQTTASIINKYGEIHDQYYI